MEDKAQELVSEFRRLTSLYAGYGQTVEQILGKVLKEHDISVHEISYRVKDPDHLMEKIQRPGKSYHSLDEITDLIGLRVITYFADDVDRVAGVIDQEFDVDHERSVDRRQNIEPDRFGYSSVHKICRMPASRTALTEYRPFKGLHCEIQIRSMVQHAWAEIEHDLGYKAGYGVPVPLRRRFSMLASLFELADDEFIRLRDELEDYSDRVSDEVTKSPQNVFIDSVSLRTFIEHDPLCRKLDEEIARLRGFAITRNTTEMVEYRVNQLQVLGFRTIYQLAQALETHDGTVLKVAELAVHPDQSKEFEPGVCINVLVQVIAGTRASSVEQIVEDLAVLGLDAPLRAERAQLLYDLTRIHKSGK